MKRLMSLLLALCLMLTLCPASFATEDDRRSLALEVELKNVSSSLFSALGYDEENEILVLKFREGGVAYAYYELPLDEYEGFMKAASLGSYFQKNIRGLYEYERLDSPAGEVGTRSSGVDYVLNTNTKKFHYPSCASVRQMKEKNRRDFTGTRAEVIEMGYSPCGNCKP